jgi:hypothetical protein
MKISDLPEGLRQLAEKRREEYPEVSVYPGTEPDHMYNQFIYDDTPEGFDFWNQIERQNYSVYHGCKVTNCKPKSKPTPA